MEIGRTLVIAGLVFVALGLLLQHGPSVPLLGKLPGDLTFERDGLRIQLPLASCLLISLVLSGVMWLLGRLR